MAKTADSASAATGAKEIGFVAEEKIDGVSIVLYYTGGSLVRAFTRGNGFVGNDVTENVRPSDRFPLRRFPSHRCVVRGEIYLPVSSSPDQLRSTSPTRIPQPRGPHIRGASRAGGASVPLQIFVYEGFFPGFAVPSRILEELRTWGQLTQDRFFRNLSPANCVLQPADHRGPFRDRPLLEQRQGEKGVDYETTGSYSRSTRSPVREERGYTGHHPRWAVAYKFESPKDSPRSMNRCPVVRTGRVTPVSRVHR
jgi:DNA ligase (NAD+)